MPKDTHLNFSSTKNKLEKNWKDTEELASKLAEREEFLVRIEDDYYSLINSKSVSNPVQTIETDFSPMNIGVSSENANAVIADLWSNFDIQFYSIKEEMLAFIKAEIIVRVGASGVIDNNNFRVLYYPKFWEENEIWTEFQDVGTTRGSTLKNYILSKSLFIARHYDEDSGVFQYYALPNFHSKLILTYTAPNYYYR